MAALALGCGAPHGVDRAGGERRCEVRAPRLPAAPRLSAREAALDARFDRARAHALVATLDRRVRLRGNAGYEASLAAADARLRSAGIEAVEVLPLGPAAGSWTPTAGELVLLGDAGEADQTLHAFDDEADRDRLLLMAGSGAVDGVFEVARPGDPSARGEASARVLFGRAPARALLDAARRERAAGIVSFAVHEAARGHGDAIGFQYLPDASGRSFGLSISDDAARAIEARLARGPARLRIRAAVERGVGRATTLVARLRGVDSSLPPVALFAHVDEPGAVDNASGVAALVELAAAMRRAVAERAVERPARDVLFLLGQELESVPLYLEAHATPAAALVLDMVGASPEAVGAELLVERTPDPGALRPIAPDASSGWGGPSSVPTAARPHALDAYVSLALARGDARTPSLPHRSHAFEGGSDHVPFLEAGVPAVLVWHFPDDAYHTSRDRIERVSAERIARVGSALGAVALGLSSDDPRDAVEAASAVEWSAASRLGHLLAARDLAAIRAFAAHHDAALARLGAAASAARERVADLYVDALRCAASLVPGE